jgi:hypothetical protein
MQTSKSQARLIAGDRLVASTQKHTHPFFIPHRLEAPIGSHPTTDRHIQPRSRYCPSNVSYSHYTGAQKRSDISYEVLPPVPCTFMKCFRHISSQVSVKTVDFSSPRLLCSFFAVGLAQSLEVSRGPHTNSRTVEDHLTAGIRHAQLQISVDA